ncbi:MAG: DUF3820 family protein [Candidatus Aenigmarchaeota archaeon]|nr:DUF3820 family protein [Candidatus Aenigmarchaeota archaeon]
MTDESIMPWGMHQGVKLANVPASYLIYQYDVGHLRGELKKYVENNMDALLIETKKKE